MIKVNLSNEIGKFPAGSFMSLLSWQDFCIPFRPDECKYTVKGPATWHDNFDWIEQDTKEMKVISRLCESNLKWE